MAVKVKAKLMENNYGRKERVRTSGKVRLSYAHLFEKYEKSGKYQATLLIDKEDEETLKAINKAIEAAKEDGKDRVWGGKIPGSSKFRNPLNDGDEMDEEIDGYEGHYYLTAKSTRRPSVFDEEKNEIFDDEDIYSGCYVSAVIEFYPYDNEGKGVGVILLGVRKTDDGERFGGGGAVASADDWDDDEDGLLDD